MNNYSNAPQSLIEIVLAIAFVLVMVLLAYGACTGALK